MCLVFMSKLHSPKLHYFDLEFFLRYCKDISKTKAKIVSSKFDSLQDYLLNTLHAPTHDLKPHKNLP